MEVMEVNQSQIESLEKRFFELMKEAEETFMKILESYIRNKEIKEEKVYTVDFGTWSGALILLQMKYGDYIKKEEVKESWTEITLEVEGQIVRAAFDRDGNYIILSKV